MIQRIVIVCVFLALTSLPTPTSALLKPDIVVAIDGTADFTSLQKAVQSIPKDNKQRLIIFLKDGIYKEKVRIDSSFITLQGQSRSGTRIEFPQLDDDFVKNPDDLGRAVVNVIGNDAIFENLSIINTAGKIGPHAFAVSGTGDRTVILDSDVLSDGADTVALGRGKGGRYYHARCKFQGSVDFLCPRGWCYITDSSFHEMKKTAAVWHDGHVDKNMKFVLHNCTFDGPDGFNLARHHHDAQFIFVDCTFSKAMTDLAPFRVIYPLAGDLPTTRDAQRNEELNKTNLWGERAYFSNCHRDGGDYAWFKDNLQDPQQVTAKWAFDGTWDPENKTGPAIRRITTHNGNLTIRFSENVTVKGKPRCALQDGRFADYISGSGSDALEFSCSDAIKSIDLNGGAILATEASDSIRNANLTIPLAR